MDEPFGALDVQTKETMQEFLLNLWQRTGTSILTITHDVGEAVFLAQRVYVLSASPGQVREEVVVQLPGDRDYHIKATSTFRDYEMHIMDCLRNAAAAMSVASVDA
jgi:NitT/TauT family transport system ATP-binding protein